MARGIAWLGILVGICVAPLVFALMSTDRPGQGLRTDFSVALGFVGLALMGVEFALVARVKAIAVPFGTDALVDFHRQIGYAGLAFVLIHVALSADWGKLLSFAPADTPARVWFGTVAAAALVVLVVTSVWRRRWRLSYEVWQILHAVLAVVAVVAALVHVLLVNYYVDTTWKRVLWSLMAAAFVWSLVWVRLLRPLRIRRRPWTVERITPERDRTTVLTLHPAGHDGLRFEPGQFAWITVGRSPFSITAHPFSFCSSAEQEGSVEVAIKAAGDFSSGVMTVRPGTRVYVDGPHGVFSIDQYEGAGFCLIAGGVGIAPALSMLETLADRGDVRPVVLFAGNRNWNGVIFRDRVGGLAARLNLKVVHVLEQPPPDWTAETGYLDADILARHLPAGFRRFQFFACGPTPMLDAVEAALVRIGAPADRVHTEHFDWV
ncbi:MAG: ferredoxin reductase family protein [Acidothermales bacterium]|nr:ferredoxin reductase family protein [Acidothermales bacterium]